MKVIEGTDFSYYDVDDTLVSWNIPSNPEMLKKAIKIQDPQTKAIWDLIPNEKTINSLKQNKLAGSTIVVWSQGGWDWAEAVVKALELQEYVDCVLSKPHRYYDDIPSAEFMGTRYDFSKDMK